jgi:hypothetical protein
MLELMKTLLDIRTVEGLKTEKVAKLMLTIKNVNLIELLAYLRS